jgi:methyl-accepting chemotaxis protein
VTQQNAALVEQAAAAAESLEEQAQNLAHSVATFKLAGGGRVSPAAMSRPGFDRAKVRMLPRKPATVRGISATRASAARSTPAPGGATAGTNE